MSKTTFVDGDATQGITGTIVTAEFLNAMNNHRHTGLDEDGAGALDYAADTGSADAYEITLDPALTANITGMPISFKAANTNTGASTLNVDGLGAVAIVKNVSTALAAGDIVSGQIVTVIYDGTNFQLINNGQAVGLSDFAASKTTNGYQKLPSGVIVQWGQVTISVSGEVGQGTVTVTLPIAFPNACFSAVASTADRLSNTHVGASLNGTTTSFSLGWINLTGSGTVSCGWVATGY